jgi:hypothetical protein
MKVEAGKVVEYRTRVSLSFNTKPQQQTCGGSSMESPPERGSPGFTTLAVEQAVDLSGNTSCDALQTTASERGLGPESTRSTLRNANVHVPDPPFSGHSTRVCNRRPVTCLCPTAVAARHRQSLINDVTTAPVAILRRPHQRLTKALASTDARNAASRKYSDETPDCFRNADV